MRQYRTLRFPRTITWLRHNSQQAQADLFSHTQWPNVAAADRVIRYGQIKSRTSTVVRVTRQGVSATIAYITTVVRPVQC